MYKHKLIDFVVQFMEEIDSEVPPVPPARPPARPPACLPARPPACLPARLPARPTQQLRTTERPRAQISAMKIQVNERARTIAYQYLKEFC